MNKQEAFDKIWNHFVVKGGKQSVQSASSAAKNGDEYEGPLCLYRGPAGARCAVGVLLSSDVIAKMKKKYGKTWNFQTVADLTEDMPSVKKLFRDMGDDGPAFLEDVQKAHDAPNSPERFQRRITEGLKGVAKRYYLAVPKK